MKRILIITSIFFFCFLFSSCSSFDTVSESKEVLGEFIQEYNDDDTQGQMDFFHSTLIEDLGGTENTEIILAARRALLGEVTSYEVTNTSFETVNQTTEVTLTLSVNYESAAGAEDTYTLLTVDDGLYITGINFEKEAVLDKFITDYYSGYANPETRRNLFIPYGKSLLDTESFELASKKVASLAGDFVDYEVISKEYALIPIDGSDAVCYAIMTLKLNYENMSFISEFQLSEENGVSGISYENMLPETIEEFRTAYANALESVDRDALLSLYNDNFFGILSDYSEDDWWNTLFAPIFANDNTLQNYEIVEWDWDTADVSGTPVNCFIIYAQSTYNNAVIQEKIVISTDDGSILGHYLQET